MGDKDSAQQCFDSILQDPDSGNKTNFIYDNTSTSNSFKKCIWPKIDCNNKKDWEYSETIGTYYGDEIAGKHCTVNEEYIGHKNTIKDCINSIIEKSNYTNSERY